MRPAARQEGGRGTPHLSSKYEYLSVILSKQATPSYSQWAELVSDVAAMGMRSRDDEESHHAVG